MSQQYQYLSCTSLKRYLKILAAIFAGFFALMMIRLPWESKGGAKRQAMKYRYFCAMSLVLVAGAIGLAETVCIKWIEANNTELFGTLIFAPMGTMLLVGLCVGISVGERALPESLPGINLEINKSNVKIAFELLLFYALAAVLICVFNSRTVSIHYPNQYFAILLTFVYSLSLATVPIIISYQSLRDTKSPGATLFGGAFVMFLIYFSVALLNTFILHLSVNYGGTNLIGFFTRFVLVEAPVSFGFGGSVYLWFRATRAVALHMYTVD